MLEAVDKETHLTLKLAGWWQVIGAKENTFWARWLPSFLVIALSVVSVFDPVAPQNTMPGVSEWPPIVDVPAFARIGQTMLAGDLAAAYETPFNQTGPLQPILAHLLWAAASTPQGQIGWDVLQISIAAGLLGSSVLIVRKGAPALGIAQQAWLVKIMAVSTLAAIGTPVAYFAEGHWWQIPVLWLWWIAASALVRRQIVVFAIAICVATALEPWGVLGMALIVFAPKISEILKAGCASLLLVMTVWLPFYLLWPFNMGSYSWVVRNDSLWNMFGVSENTFSWTMRFIQAVVILGICIAIFWSWRVPMGKSRSFRVVALFSAGPLIVLFRIAWDLHFGSYYLITAAVFLVPLGFLTFFSWGRRGLPLTVAAYLVLIGISGWMPFVISLMAGTLLAIGLGMEAQMARTQTIAHDTDLDFTEKWR